MTSKVWVTKTPREVAVTEAWWVPALPAGGASEMVVLTPPVPLPGGFRVPKDGSEAVRVTRAPGTPDALTGTDREAPSANVTSLIGLRVRVGALSTWICVVAAPESEFEAVNRRSYSPASPALVPQVNVPEVFEPFGVNVAAEGSPETSRDVMASPSGSLALTVKLRFDPSVTFCSAGALTAGARSEPSALTVI